MRDPAHPLTWVPGRGVPVSKHGSVNEGRLAPALYRLAFKMDTEASRGLGYAGVPGGTSSKNRLKGNEGRRLKAKRY